MTAYCPVCGWSFPNEDALRGHLAVHHGDVEQAPTPTEHPPSDQSPARHPAPGWYENPGGEGLRYWDGARWTDHYRAGSKSGVSTARLVISYVLAVLLPIGGLIAGILLLLRRQIGHGIAVLLISMAVAVGYLALGDWQDGGQSGALRKANEDVERCAGKGSVASIERCLHIGHRVGKHHPAHN